MNETWEEFEAKLALTLCGGDDDTYVCEDCGREVPMMDTAFTLRNGMRYGRICSECEAALVAAEEPLLPVPGRREKLAAERRVLLARLAEINAELADIPTIEEWGSLDEEIDKMLVTDC